MQFMQPYGPNISNLRQMLPTYSIEMYFNIIFILHLYYRYSTPVYLSFGSFNKNLL